jgi:glucose-6-phosphate dehydrogenase assembly protein OpcA
MTTAHDGDGVALAEPENVELLAHWQAPRVTADEVAAQLVRLRRASLPTDEMGQVQASVVNLVAYAPGAELRDRASRVIAQLASSQPSRAILLSPEPPDGDAFHLTSAVSLFGRRQGDRRVRFEQVLLRPHGGAPRHLSTLVIPLLIPHLTTVVWWMPDRPDPQDAAVRALSEFCDRIVTDSRDCPLSCLDPLAALSRRVGIGDFAWTRLDPWREMTAALFDGSASMPFLEGLEEVLIRGSRREGTAPAVPELLLAGWFAARLGLQPQRREGDRIRMIGMGRRTWIQFGAAATGRAASNGSAADDDAIRDGRLVALEMRCRHLHQSATYMVERTGDNLTARADVHGHQLVRTSRRVPLDDAALLALQLERSGRDSVFEGAVAAAAALSELVQ